MDKSDDEPAVPGFSDLKFLQMCSFSLETTKLIKKPTALPFKIKVDNVRNNEWECKFILEYFLNKNCKSIYTQNKAGFY